MLTNHHKLKLFISDKRYDHSLEVANLSKKIATHYNYPDPQNAYIAGLYHDVAKDLSIVLLHDYAKKYNYQPESDYVNSSALLHAPVGMLIIKNEFEISDSEILSAIRYHTTGRANMTFLEKTVYLADIAGSGKEIGHSLEVLKLAYTDIDKAVLLTAKETLLHLLNKGRYICKNSFECYNFYSNTQNE
ncbi:MAG: hypothetical protein A2Y40_10120 [Candidatus Margulisbacteria bacterium GWF2_35_9]|nr:MAG: hypothetical protein A2Y40_10120 [Candidatus Margulisbacteria bacterium GWF2_35_9]